jgi:hypothetical protein
LLVEELSEPQRRRVEVVEVPGGAQTVDHPCRLDRRGEILAP